MENIAIARNTKGLRDHLFSVLEKLSTGKITPQEAKAAAQIAQQIHNTARLDIDAARFVSEQRLAGADSNAAVVELQAVSLA